MFGVTLDTAGPQTLTATDITTGWIKGTSNAITVTAAVANHFVFSTPTTATAGTAFNLTVTTEAIRQHCRFIQQQRVCLHQHRRLSCPARTTTLQNGVGILSATLKTASTQTTITVTDSTVHAVTSGFITVTPGTLARFTVTGPPDLAGNLIIITVTAQDSFGNTATGYTGTVHLTSTDSQATLPANSTLSSGVGTFNVTLKTAGNQTVTAADSISTSISGNAMISVTAGSATHFVISGAPTSIAAGGMVTISVIAEDSFSNPAKGYTGTVQFSSSDAQAASLPQNTTLTNGQDHFIINLKTAGNQTITPPTPSTASITGTSGRSPSRPERPPTSRERPGVGHRRDLVQLHRHRPRRSATTPPPATAAPSTSPALTGQPPCRPMPP